jgi:putative membrane protein insertion efficiency factor
MTDLAVLGRARSPLAWLLMIPVLLWRAVPKGGLPRCRFHPSCSSYTLEALAAHGAIRGLALGIWRVLRCHPWNAGGIDQVPERVGPWVGQVRAEGRMTAHDVEDAVHD